MFSTDSHTIKYRSPGNSIVVVGVHLVIPVNIFELLSAVVEKKTPCRPSMRPEEDAMFDLRLSSRCCHDSQL